MIFLIDHERRTGRTLRYKTYDDSDRLTAHRDLLEIELDLSRRGLLLAHEVVFLEARDESTLRRTHERYFRVMPEPTETQPITQ